MRSMPRLKEEFLKDRLRLEIRTKILRRILNYRKIATGAWSFICWNTNHTNYTNNFSLYSVDSP